MSEVEQGAAQEVAAPAVENTAEALNSAIEAVTQEQEAITEQKPEVEQQAQPEKKPDDLFSKKFAALSRKEKEIRQQQKQNEALRKEIEAQKQAMESQFNPLKELKERMAKDPLKFLEEQGLSYKDLTEKFILKEEPTAEQKQLDLIKSLQDEIKAIRAEKEKEREDAKKTQAELEQKQQERAKQQYLEHLTKFVNDNADYELIRANDAVEMVFSVMDQVYRESGEIPSEKEAADAVEQHLFEEAKKLLEANKIKGIVGAQKPTIEPKKSPTLSNAVAQQVPTAGNSPVSEEESKKLAASMIKWVE